MKKLTAGILASLIGLVSANSADAAVASTKYVEDRVEALDVAKIENENAEASYIKSITETDGEISAETGALATVATTGNYNDLTTKLVFSGDATAGGFVKSVTESNGTVTVVYGDPEDGDTTYTFTDTDTVDFTATPDANGDVTVSATAKDTTYSFESGNGVTFGTPVLQADGSYKITASVTEYTASNGVKLDGTTFKANLVAGENISLTDDGTAVTIGANFDAGVAGTLDEYTEDEKGKQVLTRLCTTGEGGAKTCTYMWESIDRDYSETQPEQQVQE